MIIALLIVVVLMLSIAVLALVLVIRSSSEMLADAQDEIEEQRLEYTGRIDKRDDEIRGLKVKNANYERALGMVIGELPVEPIKVENEAKEIQNA